VQCSAAGLNKQITASAAGLADALSVVFFVGGVEPATGGDGIASSTAGGAWTTLTGPAYYEITNADVGTGTIILNAPSGFVFDTGGTAPTVRIDRLGGAGGNVNNINSVASGTSAAIASRTSTQIRFDISKASRSGVTCSLTWQNIRVRPVAASPLASGDITKTGTSIMAAVVDSVTSFGQLIETGLSQASPASAAVALFVGQPARLTEINVASNGIRITFAGSAGYTYQVHRAAALQNANTAWEEVGSATTDDTGRGEFTDLSPTAGQGYYRVVAVQKNQNEGNAR
jgi:hypothetical protein